MRRGNGFEARIARVVGIVAGAVLLLAGCTAPGGPGTEGGGSDNSAPLGTEVSTPLLPLSELELLADPKNHHGPSTAVLAKGAITPVVQNPAPVLPVTVVSRDADRPVEVTVTDVSRVLAIDISGSIAATVWGLGLGHTLVGRDISTTFPGTEHLPIVTSSGHSVNAESILAMSPTLVITDGSIGPRDVLVQLRESGVTVVFVSNDSSFEGAETLAVEVGAALGVPVAGRTLADRIRTEIDATTAEITAIAPQAEQDRLRMVFLYLRGTTGAYYLFGDGSGADDLISRLGGIDVATEIGWVGMRPVTDEALVLANPDVIFVMTKGIESAGGVDGLIAHKAAVGLTRAGENRRFVDMADGDILSFGPRSAAVLDALARAVYAPER